jgi:SAM-dependent methyltransferase
MARGRTNVRRPVRGRSTCRRGPEYNTAVSYRDPAFLALLRCPRCSSAGGLHVERALRCHRCDLEVVPEHGFLDLLDVATRGEPTPTTPEQRFMESDVVARLYERFWRPTFVRVLAGPRAGSGIGGVPGELFLHKHTLGLDEREGPWLDLSCGTGLFTRAMAAAAPGAVVIGLDISRPMLEVAARRIQGYGNVTLIRADAHSLPFADDSLGGINNPGALHAYDDPEQVFREIARVLRPGGIYVGSTFAEAPTLLGRWMARAAGIRRFDPPELRAWLGRIGLSEFEELRLGGAFVFRARKP